jgi:hypothetical protein
MNKLKLKDKADPGDLGDKMEALNLTPSKIDKKKAKTDHDLIVKFIDKLPKEYLTVAEKILADPATENKEFFEVYMEVHSFWRRWMEEESDSEDSDDEDTKVKAFQVEQGNNKEDTLKYNVPICGKVGHKAEDCWMNPDSANFDKKKLFDMMAGMKNNKEDGDKKEDRNDYCYVCGDENHKTYECPDRKTGKNKHTVEGLFAGMAKSMKI